MSKNFNEVLKQRELNEKKEEKVMSLDSTERIKVLSPGQLVFKRFINNKLAIVGSVILIVMFLFSFICPLIYPYSQTQIFYKYDDSIIDYAQAVERTDYVITYAEGAEELNYKVKNYLTLNINSLKSSGEKEMLINGADGNNYRLEANEDHVYTLYKNDMEKVASISSAVKYGEYKMLGKELTLEAGVEEVAGFDAALEKAIKAKEKEFSAGGKSFSLVQNKKVYTIMLAGEGISYEGKKLSTEFEDAFNANAEGGSFEFAGDTYRVAKEGEDSVAYKLGNETKVALLTNYVIDAVVSGTTLSNEFQNAAIEALIGNKTFSADGKNFTVKNENGELSIYDDDNSEMPYSIISTHVIRRYNGEDTIDIALKEKIREVVAKMDEEGELTSTFEWELAQVNSEGEYTYDADGNLIKQPRTFTVKNKNGSYVLSVAQVVYLIDTFAKPTAQHWVGTDGDGMDVLARMMYGGRVSLIFSFIVIFIETFLGIILGGVAGYFGGWVDNLIMRMVDVFYCIPSMPILIILGSLFDALKLKPYIRVGWLMIVLGVLGWAGVARMVRGQILSLREQEFMVATEAVGLRTKRRIFKHLIPNVMPQLIVTATSGLGGIIITESTLSYLGLGVKHPLATWGTMISSVSSAEAMKAYTYIWIPVGLLICLTVVAFNFVGDGLRDAFDPKMKR